ncbi:MAG TPA: VWA domain-containing protein [bacterium]
MEFGWPVMLWGLLLVPALVWGYIRLRRTASRRERALADPHLTPFLWQRPPALRRVLPVLLYVAAITLLLFAMARPIAAVPLPVNRAAVILAIDVSKSMIGEDVKPSRLRATQDSALEALDAVPRSTQVGIVVFSDYAQVLVPPTTDRQQLREAIEGLKLQQATGVGGAIIESLRALPGRKEFLGDKLNVGRQIPTPPAPAPPPQQGPGQPPAPLRAEDLSPAAIILFSDGVSNLGIDPATAAALAKEGRVRVFAVGVGTPAGSVMTIDGQLVMVPFDSRVLQLIAQLADGRYLDITQKDELRKAYQELGRSIGWERRRTEVSSIVVGGAGILLVTGGLLSLVWFRRVP